jgi:exosortase B
MNGRSQNTWGAGDISRRLPDASWLLAVAGLAILFVLPLTELLRATWGRSDTGHAPIIFVVSVWLFFRRWRAIADAPAASHFAAWPVLALAVLVYVVGRSQRMALLEMSSLILFLAGTLLLFRGTRGLRTAAFPLFFLCFIIPWPATVVSAVTLPMKLLVSSVAAEALHLVGYPVAQAGTILQVGQYQLLVADACAGLHSLFTLEALGLLYLNLVRHDSPSRNVLLAVAIVPIAFLSNVVRVIVLALVTFHLGDEAGRGFIHDFSGLVLFTVGLLLTICADGLFRRLPSRPSGAVPA